MKILFVTPQLPYPPQKGTTTRNFNILKNLSPNHELHLLSLGNPEDSSAMDAMKAYCRSVTVCKAPVRTQTDRIRDLFFNSKPDLALRLACGELVEIIREKLLGDGFDILQIEGLEMVWHWEVASKDARLRSRVKAVVFDEHNAEYVLQRRAYEIDWVNKRWIGAFYSFVQWQKLIRYEARICHTVDAVVAVSEADREALQKIADLRQVAIVPNGVDTAYYRSLSSRAVKNEPVLLFTGTLDFRPNVDAVSWFVNKILPLVHREIPAVKFYVVGRDPSPSVIELGKDPRVVVTGFVEDVRPYFDQALVYVVPMRFGGGVRFKVLEAMAAGVPVVSTAMGAEGIEAEPGKDLLVTDDPVSFAQAVIRLLIDETLRKNLTENARNTVERKYDWGIIVPRLEELYAAIV